MFTVKEVLKATGGKLIHSSSKRLNEVVSSISIDSRSIQKGDLFVAIKGKRFDGHDFLEQAVSEGAKIILVNNENLIKDKIKDVISILVNDTNDALGKLANFTRRKINPSVIAVVGSNGKTSTKDMIHHLLSLKYPTLKNEGTKNTHIGASLALLNCEESVEFAVLELGANHFGEIDTLGEITEPNMAVITNIGNSHLEYFQNLDNVFKEKASIIEYLKNPGVVVANQDDKYLNRLDCKHKITFGLSKESNFYASDIKFMDGSHEFLLNGRLRLRVNSLGRHNVYNTLPAVAVAKYYGISFKDIKNRLESFSFPEMRLEYSKLNNVEIINDAYNSNPDSLKAAVDTLVNLPCNRRKIVVTADMLELGKESDHLHREVGKYIASKNDIDMLISVGDFSQNVALGAEEKGMDKNNIKFFNKLDDSMDRIIGMVKPGDTLLIKGSRSMGMERLVEGIRSNFK